MNTSTKHLAILCALILPTASQSQLLTTPPLPVKLELQNVSRLLAPINTPDTTGLLGVVTNLLNSLLGKPVDMKLLILATDGTEPSLFSLQFLLDYLGTPYEVVKLAAGQPLPALSNGSKGFYQGIILTSGNLGICDPACRSTLSLEGWVALDKYARDYKVRIASYYTYPEARYGMAPTGVIGTTDAAPAQVTVTAAGASVFKYVRTGVPVKVANSYVYLASVTPVANATTTPILMIGDSVVGVTHKKSDGREYLALNMDNNPYLFHSALFHYGVIDWVTKGIFLGSRKIYSTPQVDDHFLPNDLFDSSKPACIPVGFATDPTFDPANQCPSLRITGQDLWGLAQWQDQLRQNPQFANFRVTMAFNGLGATAAGGAAPNDSLVVESVRQRHKFFWVNHTYDHENLDCFKPVANSGICRPATFAEAQTEINQGRSVAANLGIGIDQASMVTPAISGLNNPAFLSAAAAAGIRYLIADTSRPEGNPAKANTGIYNAHQPSILMIPRRPTNIFYNVTTALSPAAGSEPEEYNYFYGPNGIFRIGGPGGPPFFTTNQTWADISNREADNLVSYMLRGEIYPSMFHQSNLHLYDGSTSLFADVVGGALQKFAAVSNLPVISLTQSELGRLLANRMGYNASQVRATLTPGQSIQITTTGAASVPLTGVCSENCENYGSQKQSVITMPAGSTRTILMLL